MKTPEKTVHLHITLPHDKIKTNEVLMEKFKIIEEMLNIQDLALLLKTVCIELVNNTCLHHSKIYFFKENGYNINDPIDYDQKSKEFQKIFEKMNVAEKEKVRQEMQLKIEIELDVNKKRLLLFVHSEKPFFLVEEEQLRSKLKDIMLSDSLVSFLTKFEDITQDTGIDLALIIHLIRQILALMQSISVFIIRIITLLLV